MVIREGAKVTFAIEPFLMAKFPITVEQFQVFVDDPQGFKRAKWWRGLAIAANHRKSPEPQPFTHARNLPRVNISWYDAVAFCRWLSARVGYGICLPTEWEWQWAAQGPDGRNYPWGNEYIQGYANTDELASKIPGGMSLRGPTPVDNYPQGASPSGVIDMSGNIWEWCLNEYDPLKNTSLVGSNWRTVRGGSWDFSSKLASVVGHTNAYYPSGRFYGTGFRVRVGHFPPF